MDKGRILVGETSGNFLVKMTGDVRVTLCASLNQYIESVFKQQTVRSVLVDLRETSCLDSTTLGLLAKLALYSKGRYGVTPILFCDDASILKMFEVMGLDELFDIVPGKIVDEPNLMALEPTADEEQARQHVLEAHKLLVKINPACQRDFFDLIRYLEEEAAR